MLIQDLTQLGAQDATGTEYSTRFDSGWDTKCYRYNANQDLTPAGAQICQWTECSTRHNTGWFTKCQWTECRPIYRSTSLTVIWRPGVDQDITQQAIQKAGPGADQKIEQSATQIANAGGANGNDDGWSQQL